jgi:hypothetical protein
MSTLCGFYHLLSSLPEAVQDRYCSQVSNNVRRFELRINNAVKQNQFVLRLSISFIPTVFFS